MFASGDTPALLVQAAVAVLYMFFLTETAGLEPVLAGLVFWVARVIDAVSDPLMGLVSDRTRTRWGRRRPYFLIGALPFGILFTMMWWVPDGGQWIKFVYYAAVYSGVNLAMTVLLIPYFAAIPEQTDSYDERTDINAYRVAFGIFGTLLAVLIEPLAESLAPGATGYLLAGIVCGILIVLPWPLVFIATREKPQAAIAHEPFIPSVRTMLAHGTFRRLVGIYLTCRVALDFFSAMALYYCTYILGRREDFVLLYMILLLFVLPSLPAATALARRFDKRTVVIVGMLLWMAMLPILFAAQPDWPRWIFFTVFAVIGVAYTVVDLMPWAMLGEVVDEDAVRTGHRRDGLYSGLFMFLRKLGGAIALAITGLGLSLAGHDPGQEPSAAVELAVRIMLAVVPFAFLSVTVALAWRYPLTRAVHEEIMARLRGHQKVGTGRDAA